MLSKTSTACLSSASFQTPRYFCQSAWIEHAPFAFWLADALRPQIFVELGSHYGFSYFAFCQAFQHIGSQTAAYAVDTWRGDEHAGFYSNAVFESVQRVNRQYSAFSRLTRSTFADAVAYFADGSIDLLHIDGRHFYEDVKEDFELWRPKLTKRAIVLFHDINVRERDFGVWKYFAELSEQYPTFSFLHGNGLGVLAHGEVPPPLSALFDASREETDEIRNLYGSLGGRLLWERAHQAKQEAIAAMLQPNADLSPSASEELARLSDWDPQIQELRARFESLQASIRDASVRFDEALIARTAALENEKHVLAEALEASAREQSANLLALTQARTNEAALAERLKDAENALEAQRVLVATLPAAVGPASQRQSERNGQSFEHLRSLLAEMVVLERRHLQTTEERHRQEIDALRQQLEWAAQDNVRLASEIDALRHSTSWRLTRPLRHTLERAPVLHGVTRTMAKAAYWTATGQVARRLKARKLFFEEVKRNEALALASTVSASESTHVQPPPEAARALSCDYSVSIPFAFATEPAPQAVTVAAIIHLFYEDLAVEFRSYLVNVPGQLDVYVSTTDDFKASVIRQAFFGWQKGKVEVRVVANRGRDIAPKIVAFADVYPHYEYVLHMHGKRSKHAEVLAPWRHFLLESLTGTEAVTQSIFHIFRHHPEVGMIGAQHFEPMRHWLNWGGNFDSAQDLAHRMGFKLDPEAPLDFPSGSMFWARTAALKPLLDLALSIEDFDEENNQTDATFAHAIERLFFYVCEHAGYDWVKIARPELYEHTPTIVGVPRPKDLSGFLQRYVFRLLSPGSVRPRSVAPPPVSRATPRLATLVQNHALGVGLTLSPATRVAIGLLTFNNAPEELQASITAARSALAHAGLLDSSVLLILDNGASTEEWLAADALIRRLPPVGNVGFGAGHNVMMRAAFEQDFDVYLALNPDGLLHPDSVLALLQMLEAAQGRALIEALQFPSEHPKPYDTSSFDTPWTSGACLAIPRQAFLDLDGFDEDFFMYCEDVDLSWRAKAQGYALKTCPRALFLHAVTNRPENVNTLRMVFESGIVLARKWGAFEFEDWLKTEMLARRMTIPSRTPMLVPDEWRHYADFSHQFSFAQPRW